MLFFFGKLFSQNLKTLLALPEIFNDGHN